MGANRLLISSCEVEGRLVDVVIEHGTIVDVAAVGRSSLSVGEVIDARCGALLPGLHDHHLHLLAMAAARTSIDLLVEQVTNWGDLALRLRQADKLLPAGEWLRVVGYHESIAGDLDRAMLDGLSIRRPIRVQHRSGALWILDLRALTAVGVDALDPEYADGRLWRKDTWLGQRVPRGRLDLAAIGEQLASSGITGVTDLTPTADPGQLVVLSSAVACGHIPQHLTVTGAAGLSVAASPELARGPIKIVIEDHGLPPLDWVIEQFRRARALGRCLAVHSVTIESLALAIVAWQEVGPMNGDRIEHGAVISPAFAGQLAELGIVVVTQPSFVQQRGDDYLRDVDLLDRPDLWRCQSLIDAGVAVAFGSDAPYGPADPWLMVANAMHRRTQSGIVLGASERVAARSALDAMLGTATNPTTQRTVSVGQPADLCLLNRPLREQLVEPAADAVHATLIGGRIAFLRSG